MGQLSRVQVQLLSGFLQPLFYGIYIVTLGFCLKALLRCSKPNQVSQSGLSSQWRKNSDMNKPMLIVTIFMAIIATLDLVITFMRGWRTFTTADNITDAEEILGTHSGWMDIVGVRSELFCCAETRLKASSIQYIDATVMTILGDGILIYRCFLTYNRSWRAISGSLFLAASGIAFVATSIYLQTSLAPGQQFSSPYKEVGIAAWSTTIGVNLLTTGVCCLTQVEF
jgi:hypothetical protein